jgi:hypothetical protein
MRKVHFGHDPSIKTKKAVVRHPRACSAAI